MNKTFISRWYVRKNHGAAKKESKKFSLKEEKWKKRFLYITHQHFQIKHFNGQIQKFQYQESLSSVGPMIFDKMAPQLAHKLYFWDGPKKKVTFTLFLGEFSQVKKRSGPIFFKKVRLR